jgi:hypothetical protein
MYSFKKIMKIFIQVFPMDFQSLMGLRNKGVIVPSGSTQGNSYSSPKFKFCRRNFERSAS